MLARMWRKRYTFILLAGVLTGIVTMENTVLCSRNLLREWNFKKDKCVEWRMLTKWYESFHNVYVYQNITLAHLKNKILLINDSSISWRKKRTVHKFKPERYFLLGFLFLLQRTKQHFQHSCSCYLGLLQYFKIEYLCVASWKIHFKI